MFGGTFTLLDWGGSTFLCRVLGTGWAYKHSTTHWKMWRTSLESQVEVIKLSASIWAAVQRGCLHTAGISRAHWPPLLPTNSGCPVPLPAAGRPATGRPASPGAVGQWAAGVFPVRLAWPGESPVTNYFLLTPILLRIYFRYRHMCGFFF